uniref:HMG box domain-containing protein n=1 Tax=Lactuca sativa TaxID=4236 RepID=A0A9R1WMS7_LACSA|nr:hypothetical protein LSAT_V11C100031590 [Lactuca sativa]
MQDQMMKGSKSSGATRKADTKLAVKKTAAKGKAAKDPNKPKRPASAFFVFMEDFRKQFKEDHPDNKSVAAVWVLDATPGKVCAGRDGDDHPAELIISLRALPNQVTSKMEVISGLVREGFLNDVAQRDLGSQLVASIFELVCNPFLLSASGVILNRMLKIFKEAMFLCIDDATKGRDVFKEKPPPDELMAASDIGKSVTTSLPENVVWAIADSRRQGFLGFKEFITTMQLISMAQVGHTLSSDLLNSDVDYENLKPPVMDSLDVLLAKKKLTVVLQLK